MDAKQRFQRVAALAAARAILRINGVNPAVAGSPAALNALRRSPYQVKLTGGFQRQFRRDWQTWQKQGRLQ
ncbi:MAG: hypothetical protein FOGNACKC_05531 [Anaerolineae bacterium]|nr:hypothetical protein [Anaerolineae bacterium]